MDLLDVLAHADAWCSYECELVLRENKALCFIQMSQSLLEQVWL